MSQPMLIHHDQRQCQQVYGEQSTGPYLPMSSPGATEPRLGGADTSTHYALAPCCQREDLQSVTKPWWATYPSQLSLGSCRDPQPHNHSSTEPAIHPAGERHGDKHHVGPHNVGRAQTERVLLLSATSCSLSAQRILQVN